MVEELEVFLVYCPAQSCSLSAEQIVDNPVPRFRRGFGGGLHGLHPGQSSTAFGEADHRAPAATAEQNVDIPAPRGAPRDFHQNPLAAAGSSDSTTITIIQSGEARFLTGEELPLHSGERPSQS